MLAGVRQQPETVGLDEGVKSCTDSRVCSCSVRAKVVESAATDIATGTVAVPHLAAVPMPTTEHTINDALAAVLRQTRRCWQADGVVRSENTGTLQGSQKRPDILIAEPHVSPVVIETEVVPAATVEADAFSRLGSRLSGTGRKILSSIAVRLPATLRQHQNGALRSAIRATGSLEMALYTGATPADAIRLPQSGWLSGDLHDLSILAQHASVPPDVISDAATALMAGIVAAAGLLGEAAATHPAVTVGIGKELRQEDCEQTRRMAAAILANAFVFHHSLVRGPGDLAGVRTIEELRGSGTGLSQPAVLSEWRKILAVNYWPIFDIARRILSILPTALARQIIATIAETADQLVENRLMRSHDLTGAVFQQLIADRKFLAAYYTTPAASALLSGIALSPSFLTGLDWKCRDAMAGLRIADFACGTGTLLSTAYQRLGQLHELAGGDSQAIHPQMMGEALVGCDVLPAASHLTASMLAGSHPTVKYARSKVLTVDYGGQVDGRCALGSLDLLDPQGRLAFDTITAHAADGAGQAETDTWLALPHAAFDLVVMNPPFTRASGHEGKSVGVPNPIFAAFGATGEEQRQMGRAVDRLSAGTCYDVNAGEASLFLQLGDRKLRPGGALALVLPLALMGGEAWEACRRVLTRGYTELIVVSIAAAKDFDLSFSADTGAAECLVVCRKRTSVASPADEGRGVFVTLNARPGYPLVGAQIARQIGRLLGQGELRRLEDGPVGGTPIQFGDDLVGSMLDAPLPESAPWPLSRIRDLSLAQTAYQIASNGRFWLPGASRDLSPTAVISTVGAIGGRIGPHHRDIQRGPAVPIRGPFHIDPVSGAPTYPVLWGHQASRERTMAFDADCEGRPLTGRNTAEAELISKKVEAVWATATHCHFNRDFRFNSQSTAVQYTDRPTIGGRAWLSVGLANQRQEKALAAWGNTTFGLLMYWWHSTKQQGGRGSIPKTALGSLPVLDVTKLPAATLTKAVQIFDAMRGRELLPLNEIDTDPVRRELDDRFARLVLGFDKSSLLPNGPLDILRKKLANEPSITRGKKTTVGAPRGTRRTKR